MPAWLPLARAPQLPGYPAGQALGLRPLYREKTEGWPKAAQLRSSKSQRDAHPAGPTEQLASPPTPHAPTPTPHTMPGRGVGRLGEDK